MSALPAAHGGRGAAPRGPTHNGRAADCQGHLTLGDNSSGSRPPGTGSLADSPLFPVFHALFFCVELFERRFQGSFMLMHQTKAKPEAGVPGAGRGGQAARVSRVPRAAPAPHSCKHKAFQARAWDGEA